MFHLVGWMGAPYFRIRTYFKVLLGMHNQASCFREMMGLLLHNGRVQIAVTSFR